MKKPHTFQTVQITAFTDDWHDGLLISEICQRHTLSRDQVVRLRIRLDLAPRLDCRKRKRPPEVETPTREEIAERSAEIRAGWTPEVERRRRGLDEENPYEIPQMVETPEDFDPRWYEG